MIIDNETGELLEENKENYMIARKELGELEIFGDWIEKQEQLLMAKEQFDMVDKPFRRILKELFEKYSIKRLENDYMDVILKNGYNKSSWNELSAAAKKSNFSWDNSANKYISIYNKLIN